tara:strand:- start:1298 stop:1825 length:528 start_codon:yes stop_codon:yes gene_type:complete
MSCDIANGRLEPCKDSVGGINAVYFVNYGDITSVTYDSTDTDVIDGVVGSPNAYKFDVRGNSTYTENIQSSRENGTTAFEQVLELSLKKLTKKDHSTIKLLSFGRPHVIIEDNNGNRFLAGLEHGADVTGGTIVTGGAMGDMSGYTLSFNGMEKIPANFIDGELSAVGFTVVAGV